MDGSSGWSLYARVRPAKDAGRLERCSTPLARLAASLAVTLLILLGLACWPAWAQVVGRVSVTSDGGQSNGESADAVISADGRIVAFDAIATNLVPGCTNGTDANRGIFVHDRITRQTTCASVASNGASANGRSLNPSLSADGRFVAFQSNAANLPGANGSQQVYVRDRVTSTTRLVSALPGSEIAAGNGASFFPVTSADGRIVAFASLATNLDAFCANGFSHIYVRDLIVNTTKCESFGVGPGPADGDALVSALSADGRFLAFDSSATNLTSGCGFGVDSVYLIDRVSDTIECVSVDADGVEGSDNSAFPAVSNDGRIVVFTSFAGNLAAGCGGTTNGDVFVHDRETRTTSCVSRGLDGLPANGETNRIPSISADGRFVTFNSRATNLVAQSVPGGFLQIYVHDRLAGRRTLLSTAADGSPGNGDSFLPSVSSGGDARLAAFTSSAGNLLPGDGNGVEDAFVARLAVGPNWLVAAPAGGNATRVLGFDAVGNPSGLDRDTALTGGARVALGDVNGDGAADLVVGAGPGAPAGGRVRVFFGSTAETVLTDFEANPGAPGGATVAACNFDANVQAEIVTGPGASGGALVKLWRFNLATSSAPASISQVLSFPAYASSPGGVNVACGVLDGTGVPYVVTGPGAGSPPLVKVFSVNLSAGTATEVTSFLAYPEDFTGGVSVAVGDVRRLGRGSIITGPGFGFPPLVRVWTLSQPATKAGAPALAPDSQVEEAMSVMPFGEDSLGGVNVGAGDTTGEGGASLLAGRGPGGPPDVSSFGLGGNEPQPQQTVMAGSPDSRNGAAPAAPPVTATSPLLPSTSTTFFVVVQKVGGGNGTVTSTPAGIDCGPACSKGYARGAAVTLTAQAAPGSDFLGWTGCDVPSGTSCTVNASATRLVTAIFNGGPNTLTLRLNQPIFRVGHTMVVTVTLRGDVSTQPVDAYVVLRLPDGSFFSLQANGQAVPGIHPIATGFLPFDVEGELLRYTFTGAEPPGVYTWFVALVQSGTGTVLGAIDQDSFTITP